MYGNDQSCNLKFGFKMSDYVQDDVDLDDIEYAVVAFDGEVLVRERESNTSVSRRVWIFSRQHVHRCMYNRQRLQRTKHWL